MSFDEKSKDALLQQAADPSLCALEQDTRFLLL
jgi:hypothetical protein